MPDLRIRRLPAPGITSKVFAKDRDNDKDKHKHMSPTRQFHFIGSFDRRDRLDRSALFEPDE